MTWYASNAFDIVRVVRGDITGMGPLHAFPVAVRRGVSRRKRRQDVVRACLRHRRSARRQLHPAREMRLQAAWCHEAWLRQRRGEPSACACGAVMLTGNPETCPFCGEWRAA